MSPEEETASLCLLAAIVLVAVCAFAASSDLSVVSGVGAFLMFLTFVLIVDRRPRP